MKKVNAMIFTLMMLTVPLAGCTGDDDGDGAYLIDAGYEHTCAILDDGSVSCWGDNNYGQLGDGTTTDRNTSTQTSSLGTDRTAVAITAVLSVPKLDVGVGVNRSVVVPSPS